MRRWSLLTPCVSPDMRISENVGVAESVVTVMSDPVTALAGALVMTGRVLSVPSGLKRYGGD
jgi:hypothetical protein